MNKYISFGFSQLWTLAEFKYFCNKYQNILSSIYFCPPDRQLAKFFCFRDAWFLNSVNKDTYNKAIDLARSLGIKINFTLNNPIYNQQVKNFTDLVNNLLLLTKEYQPEEICCADCLIDILKIEYNTFYIRTLYEGDPDIGDLPEIITKYDSIVLRNTYPWVNQALINNKENRILINTGCPITCKMCQSHHYEHPFDENYKYYNPIFGNELQTLDSSIEKYLAHHTLLGRDIELLNQSFTTYTIKYKFGSRMGNKSFKETDALFENYSNFSNSWDWSKQNFIAACNTPGLCEYLDRRFDWSTFSQDLFYQEKLNWWKQLNPQVEKY